jgi:hypothetical protein
MILEATVSEFFERIINSILVIGFVGLVLYITYQLYIAAHKHIKDTKQKNLETVLAQIFTKIVEIAIIVISTGIWIISYLGVPIFVIWVFIDTCSKR